MSEATQEEINDAVAGPQQDEENASEKPKPKPKALGWVFHKKPSEEVGRFTAPHPDIELVIGFRNPTPDERGDIAGVLAVVNHKIRLQNEYRSWHPGIVDDEGRAQPEPRIEQIQSAQVKPSESKILAKWLASKITSIVGVVDGDGKALSWSDFDDEDRAYFAQGMGLSLVASGIEEILATGSISFLREPVKNS